MSEESIEYRMIYDGSRRSDVLTFTVTQGITKGLEYHFKISAINAVGTGGLSPVLTCLAAVVPSEPQNFEVTGSNTGTVSVSW